MKNLFLLASAAFLLGCGPSSGEKPVAADNRDCTANPGKQPSDPKSGGDCCFQSEAEATQFFPDGAGEVTTPQPAGGTLACTNGGLTNFSRNYMIGDAKYDVRIFDYCSRPGDLKSDYDRRLSSAKKDNLPAKEFSGANYTGYTAWNEKAKTDYLLAIVDGRFKLQISAQGVKNGDDITKVFALIPVDKLAAFGK